MAQMTNAALTAVLIGWIFMPIVGLWATIGAYATTKRNNTKLGLF